MHVPQVPGGVELVRLVVLGQGVQQKVNRAAFGCRGDGYGLLEIGKTGNEENSEQHHGRNIRHGAAWSGGMANVVDDARHNQKDPEHHYNRGPRGIIRIERPDDPRRACQDGHQPTQQQAGTHRLAPHLSNDGGHHQIRKHEQNSDDGHGLGDDHPEGHIEKDVPQPDTDPAGLRPLGIQRDEQEFLSEHDVEDADASVQKRHVDDGRQRDQKHVPHEHVLDFLPAGRGFGEEENRGSRGRRINNADEGFLRNFLFAHPRDREGAGAHECEGEGKEGHFEGIAVGIVAQHESVGGAQSRDLRQRQVDEDDLARNDVDSQIDMVDGQHEAGKKREQHPLQLQHLRHVSLSDFGLRISDWRLRVAD